MFGTHLRSFRDAFSKSLRLRVMALTLGAFVAVSVPACLSFVWIVNATVVKLGTLFAEKQILYDRSRGLEALMRELALAETLARSPVVLAWANDEKSPAKRSAGLAELEHYRDAFRDRSYFFVVNSSGNYYFNDRDDAYRNNQLRYTLSRENPRDGWYYKTAAMGPGCQLNVDNDDILRVTKVWINCIVTDAGRTVGIIGTGIDLTSFIRDVVNAGQDGVESMFVDQSGAVQANRDASRIDFHSLTKETGARKTVFQMVDSPDDRAALAEMLANVSGSSDVESRFLEIGGRSMLVGVGYLDQLGWYNVAVMDVDKIIDRGLFLPIAALLALVMLAATVLMTWLFKRSVLDRIEAAEGAVARIEAGDFSPAKLDASEDEIGRLSAALTRMAMAVRDNTAMLEDTVRERTAQLRSIAYFDPMTGLLNRRGFADAFAEAQAGRARTDVPFGMLVLDIDRFKTINDTRGHSAGDAVITEVARRLSTVVEDSHIVARWGGDEFVVLVAGCRGDMLRDLSRRILDALRGRAIGLAGGARLRITTSIGAYDVGGADSLELAAHRADIALYAAKNEGRNRMVAFDPGRHDNAPGHHRVA
jgi:diguanylate cyclase (GGDEF)-like protein